MSRTMFLVLWSLTVGLLCFAAEGCREKKDRSGDLIWETTTDVVEKDLPFLGHVASSSWRSGVLKDLSYGVPAPSIYFWKGYAVLTEEDANRIKNSWVWTKSPGVKVGDLEMPPQGPKLSGDVLISENLNLAHFTSWDGPLYFLPEVRIVYFDLTR